MTSYTLTSERIMSVTFKTNTGLATIIQVYTPDSSYDDDEIENFYNISSKRLIIFFKNLLSFLLETLTLELVLTTLNQCQR